MRQILELNEQEFREIRKHGYEINANGINLLLVVEGALVWKSDTTDVLDSAPLANQPKRRRKQFSLNEKRNPKEKKERVLRYIIDHGESRLTDLARGVHMAATTVHSVLDKGAYRELFESRTKNGMPMWGLSAKGREQAALPPPMDTPPPEDKEVQAMLNAPESAIARNGHRFFTLTEKDYVIRQHGKLKEADEAVLDIKKYIAANGPSHYVDIAKFLKKKPPSVRWILASGGHRASFKKIGSGKYAQWTLRR